MKKNEVDEKKEQALFPSHAKSIDEVEQHFKTDRKTGLSEEEAKRRLEEYGPNKLEEKKKVLQVNLKTQHQLLLVSQNLKVVRLVKAVVPNLMNLVLVKLLLKIKANNQLKTRLKLIKILGKTMVEAVLQNMKHQDLTLCKREILYQRLPVKITLQCTT